MKKTIYKSVYGAMKSFPRCPLSMTLRCLTVYTRISVSLLKEIVFSPGEIFKNPREKKDAIILLFIINFVIILIKSFFIKGYGAIDFFDTQILNEIFYFLSISQIQVIISYFLFFVFVLLLFFVIKIFSGNASLSTIMLSLMSISGIGIIAHITAIPLMFFEKSLLNYISYLFGLWILILTFGAVKTSQNLTLIKAVLFFLIAAFPFLLFVWLPVISPYLVFLID